MVNGQRLKHYKGGEVEKLISVITLEEWNLGVKLYDVKRALAGRQYSPQAIDDSLGNPFSRQEEKCHYQRLCSRKKGFSNRKVAATLCMPDKGYQIVTSGKETRIRRGDMRTLLQV